jgi:HEPN domain-containing protein/predicted nucleotidyltransferase
MENVQNISRQIREKVENLSDIKIVSLAIFGSTARYENNMDSDIDILVVAEDIAKKRIHRIPDMVRIERELDLESPVDVLLVSKNECQSNFRNHNPLYLDIAFDAEIIYDDTGFLRGLIEETQEYVATHNIRRGVDSWSFPVKEHTVTKLSSITNKEWALTWLADGERDLLAASHLLRANLFEKVVYHCQQAVEKATKAVLAAWGEFVRTHRVANILRKECKERELGEWEEKLLTVADIGNTTEPHVALSRYPELNNNALWVPCEEYDIDIATEYLEKAELVINIVKKFIEWWFRPA